MAFLATTNADEAQHFYKDVLGLELISRDNYALLLNANGINLRVALVPEYKAPAYSVISWLVDDINTEVDELSSKGVKFEQYGMPGQDEKGVWTSLDGTKVAWFKDPQRNILSLTKFV